LKRLVIETSSGGSVYGLKRLVMEVSMG